MAKSRKEKNKKLYEELENEMRNNKEDSYEKKLKKIDPNLDASGDAQVKEKLPVVTKKNETKNTSALTVIAKKVNGNKMEKKHELVKVEKKKRKEKEEDIIDVEELEEPPVSYTDKLSIEAILRAKIEQQQKIKEEKRNLRRSPNDDKYTPEMMQERIKPHVGVDVRKEVKLVHKDHRKLALGILIITLIAVIIFGALLIFKII